MAAKKKTAPAANLDRAETPAVMVEPDRVEAAARALPRRRFFDDMPDKGLFAIFALVGFLLIVLLKTKTVVPSEVVAGLAIGAMVLYGIAAYQLPAVRIGQTGWATTATTLDLSTRLQVFAPLCSNCNRHLESSSFSATLALPC